MTIINEVKIEITKSLTVDFEKNLLEIQLKHKEDLNAKDSTIKEL